MRRAASLEEFMASARPACGHSAAGPIEAGACRAVDAANESVQPDDDSPHGSGNPVAGTNTSLYREVSDRFGDYGTCRRRNLQPDKTNCAVTTPFLLSCRVLGRGVEHRIAAFLGTDCSSAGLVSGRLAVSSEREELTSAGISWKGIDFGENVQPARMGSFYPRRLRPIGTDCSGRAPRNGRRAQRGRCSPEKPMRRSVDYAYIANHLACAPARFCTRSASASRSRRNAESMTETEGRVGPHLGRSAGAPLRLSRG